MAINDQDLKQRFVIFSQRVTELRRRAESLAQSQANAAAETAELATTLVDSLEFLSVVQEDLRLKGCLLDAIGQAVIASRPDGTIIYWNRTAEQLYGWRADEVLGRNVGEIVVNELHRDEADAIMTALRRGAPWSGEFIVCRRDGTTFPALVTDSPVYGVDGALTAIIGVSVDVTERVQGLARFHAENPNPVMRLNAGGRVLFANEAGRALLQRQGVTGDEAVAPWRGLAEEVLANSTRMTIEREEGDRTYAFTVVPGHEADYVNFYGVDITERKRAEEALRRQAALIDLSTDGIFVRRLDGTITFWNRGAQVLYGWSSHEAIGRLTQDLLQTRYPRPLDEIIAELRQSGRWRGQLVHRAKDGREIVVQSSWQAKFDERGNVTELMESNVDVTERQRLLEAETAARREAERANALRLRFLGMISHELRTPLQAIKGFATTLLAPDVTWGPDEQRDFLRTIDQEADKLSDMIDQLLDLSRLESGTLRIDPQTQTVSTLLAAAQPQLNALAAQHLLTISLPGELPPVAADGQRVAQVLTNLVSNAAKYSPPGTAIDIDAALQGEFVRVNVRDVGPGITAQDRPSVFEAFRRGSDGQARQTKGAGLGLAICKGIVEAHGGSIWIADREGPGTTFSFTLPVAGTD